MAVLLVLWNDGFLVLLGVVLCLSGDGCIAKHWNISLLNVSPRKDRFDVAIFFHGNSKSLLCVFCPYIVICC